MTSTPNGPPPDPDPGPAAGKHGVDTPEQPTTTAEDVTDGQPLDADEGDPSLDSYPG